MYFLLSLFSHSDRGVLVPRVLAAVLPGGVPVRARDARPVCSCPSVAWAESVLSGGGGVVCMRLPLGFSLHCVGLHNRLVRSPSSLGMERSQVLRCRERRHASSRRERTTVTLSGLCLLIRLASVARGIVGSRSGNQGATSGEARATPSLSSSPTSTSSILSPTPLPRLARLSPTSPVPLHPPASSS